MIQIINLFKQFKEADRTHIVLDNITAEFGPNQVIAIIGRSGSGKSTLLNLLAGLDVPTSGEIWIADTCVTKLDDRRRTLFRRNHIGFVFQFFNLIPTLTVGENVLLTAELSGRKGPDARTEAEKFLTLVDLLDRFDNYPDKLSGGEQQRVAIARALCSDPNLILADEPTGNLDSDTGMTVMKLMVGLARERSKSMVIVTHSRDIAAMADRILKLDHGHLADLDSKS